MSVLKKSEDGLLYYEDFSDPNSLMWTLSPSHMSHVLEFGAKGPVVTERGLRIKHSDKYVVYTMPEPVDRDEYGVIYDISHVPVKLKDIAGIIVIGSTNQYVECQSYMATGPSEIINSDDFLVDLEGMVSQGINEQLGNKTLTETVDELVYNKLREYGYIVEAGGEPATGDDPFGGGGFGDNPFGDSGFGGGDNTFGDNEPDDEPDTPDSEEESEESEEPEQPASFIDTIYRYIKVYKIKHKYYFYASPDMYDWIEVGNVSMESSAGIGLFIYGTEDNDILTNGRFKCNWLAFYSSRFINIYGIDSEKQFEILSGDKLVIRTDATKYLHMMSRDNRVTVINTTELPMPIKNATLRVFPKRDYETTDALYSLGDIYGGDSYKIMNDIKVYIESPENEVYAGRLYNLGTFYHGETYIKMMVHNTDSSDALNVRVSVVRQSIYYGGDEFVSIGLFDDNYPDRAISYSKTVVIPMIRPSESKTIYIKLTDDPSQNSFMRANDFRFKVIIDQ